MGRQQDLKCANCGIVIRWQPTLVDDNAYCCNGCAEGGPCACDYDNLPQLGSFKPMVHQSIDRASVFSRGASPSGE